MFKIKNPRKMRLIKPKSWRKSPVPPVEEVVETPSDNTEIPSDNTETPADNNDSGSDNPE